MQNDQVALNFSGMAAKTGRSILFLHKDTISRVTVLTHKEFLEKVNRQPRTSWITKLQICV